MAKSTIGFWISSAMITTINPTISQATALVVEQSQRSMCEHNTMLIRSLDALSIHHASTWCSQVLHTALPRPVYVIGEREESVA